MCLIALKLFGEMPVCTLLTMSTVVYDLMHRIMYVDDEDDACDDDDDDDDDSDGDD